MTPKHLLRPYPVALALTAAIALGCGPPKPPSLADLVSRVKPSIVLIQVLVTNPSTTGSPGCQRKGGLWTGTGFAVRAPTFVLTNDHVVTPCPTPEPSYRILATMADGQTVEAELVGHDPLSDLAVLRLKVATLEPLPFLSPDSVREGLETVVIGFPNGDEDGASASVTRGIISAPNRRGLEQRPDAMVELSDLIQTDAAVNHGNSGGPMLDVFGRVVGVIALGGGDQTEGINMAISGRVASKVASDIIETGGPRRAVLGIVSGIGITESGALASRESGAPLSAGLLIGDPTRGSPAAGVLRFCDQIEDIDAVPIRGLGDLNNALLWLEPGRTVAVGFRRYPQGKCEETRSEIASALGAFSWAAESGRDDEVPVRIVGVVEEFEYRRRAQELCAPRTAVDRYSCETNVMHRLKRNDDQAWYLAHVKEKNEQILRAQRSEGSREVVRITLR